MDERNLEAEDTDTQVSVVGNGVPHADAKNTKAARPYSETPLMKQYYEIKSSYPDAILLFRVGDFYETFGEDAIFAAKTLNIVLAKRANGAAAFVELAGFPHHALDKYLHKLVKAGGKVAICEQLEDPKLTKTIVKRGVSELITPGVALDEKILDSGKNNFLCALYFCAASGSKAKGLSFKTLSINDTDTICKTKNTENLYGGISFLDVSTGEYFVAEGNMAYIKNLLDNYAPSEIILSRQQKEMFNRIFSDKHYITTFEDWVFKVDFSNEILTTHFKTNTLKGFGVEDMTFGLISAAACLHYLIETKHKHINHVSRINRLSDSNYVWLDRFTIRNLELLESNTPCFDTSSRNFSLFYVLNQCSTPMGSRLLRRYITQPVCDVSEIERRLRFVKFFVDNTEANTHIFGILSFMGDIERTLSKVATMRAQPRDLELLRNTLLRFGELRSFTQKEVFANIIPKDESDTQIKKLIESFLENVDLCSELYEYISLALSEEPAPSIQKGRVIADGFNEELDELRAIAFSGKDYLVNLQRQEINRTGITSLKLGFNNVYGYYLEVTHAHKEKVPADWTRKQTLVSGERYITEELKVYEEKVLSAQDKIFALETTLYNNILLFAQDYIKRIQDNAQKVAFLDVTLSFAKVSFANNYCMPLINNGSAINIKAGRHPIIEQNMPLGEKYIPNDIFLDTETCQIMMITGPNMSGKSAVLRQTALICIMAQIGCFVPAQSAEIGLLDKLFTRVGASDNIALGESTFMVEMNETANILNNLTSNSLVLLDEIGRGTSTYDGISIAQAISEYLHQVPSRAKVLFATHYHELNILASKFERIKNYHVKIKEVDKQILFLRVLEEGGSEHSFGIHVARMAGMPQFIIERAEEVLENLEASRSLNKGGGNANILSRLKSKIPDNIIEDEIKSNSNKLEIQNIEEEAKGKTSTDSDKKPYQLSFIQLDDPLLEDVKEEILSIEIDNLTPVEALNKLYTLKKMLSK